jgi:serine/threonine-protein kinase
VAVKLFPPVSSDDRDQVLALIVRSARRVACIDHPNVVRLYECGDWRGRPYHLMELVSGIALSSLQGAYASRRLRLPLDLALFIACEVAEGLSGARVARDQKGVQLGIVHHGISAQQVLLSWRGEVKVSDFEATVVRAATSSIRSLRGVTSRASMMAPEVAQGGRGDSRSDVFSLGILLRELVVGPRFPTSISDADAILLAREGYIHPLTFQPRLPEGLHAVISRAIDVDPGVRYPNACALATDLRRVALGMGVGDGRYFLRKVLAREWPQFAEETTLQRSLGPPATNDDHYGLDDSGVLPLPERRR